jgi:hypothetical protein
VHLDPHIVVHSPKYGYALILCDYFQHDPPSVGYVVLDVVGVPCKDFNVSTSSYGIQCASHGYVSHCMEMAYSITKVRLGRLLPPD